MPPELLIVAESPPRTNAGEAACELNGELVGVDSSSPRVDGATVQLSFADVCLDCIPEAGCSAPGAYATILCVDEATRRRPRR